MLRVLAVAIVLGAVMVGCGSASTPDAPEGDAMLSQGRAVYIASCRSCHGDAGGGNRGPNITGDRMKAEYPDIADQIAVVTNGREGMPSFGDALDPTEIEAVVLYTREIL
jgi:mono/diheme cytochrome c family protein